MKIESNLILIALLFVFGVIALYGLYDGDRDFSVFSSGVFVGIIIMALSVKLSSQA